MNRKEYNGWTNYETWLCKLWLDEENFISSLCPTDTLDEIKQAVRDWFDCCQDEMTSANMRGLAVQAMTNLIFEIDVDKIAEHYLDELSNYEIESEDDDE